MIRDGECSLSIEPLGREHNRAAFCCGVEALDRYLTTQASQDARRNVAAPFVAVEGGSSAILGFYTLSMTSLDLGKLPEIVQKKLPRYEKIPAVLLGRLAVDRHYRGKGLGRFLLMDALERSLQSEIAWVAVVVEAKDESACSFYEKYGFIRFFDQPNKLFLIRNTIEAAFR